MNGRYAQPDMGGGGVSLLNVIDVNQQRRPEVFLGSLLATYGIFQHLSRDTTWMSLICLLCAWIYTAIDFTFARRAPQFCPAAHVLWMLSSFGHVISGVLVQILGDQVHCMKDGG
jgi:hypothetical protein